jgi:hypothetical protein
VTKRAALYAMSSQARARSGRSKWICVVRASPGSQLGARRSPETRRGPWLRDRPLARRPEHHVALDALGNAIRLLLTAGQLQDSTRAEALIEGFPAKQVIADKTPTFRADAVIPSRASRAVPIPCDRHTYKEGYLVECLIRSNIFAAQQLATTRLPRHFSLSSRSPASWSGCDETPRNLVLLS